MTTPPAHTVKAVIDGEELTRWTSYEIESDIIQPADAFSLTAPNPGGELSGVFGHGSTVEIYIDEQLQMTGYVDDVIGRSGEDGPALEIVGRDKFSFICDCSAPLMSKKNQTLASMAELLTSEWIEAWAVGITLSNHTRVKIEPGETYLDVLSRLAQKDRVLFWMDPNGQGVIDRPNYAQAPLYNIYHYPKTSQRRHKNNVFEATVTSSWRDRYSSITVYGTKGNTKADYGQSSRAKAIAIDTDIEPARHLIISDGDIKNLQNAQQRADDEVARRKFESLTLEYRVRGHYGLGPSGWNLWQCDTLVDVDDEVHAQQGSFYITKRRYTFSEQGRFTDLTLRQKGLWLT